MATAGYSKRPLLEKLGIKAGQRVCFVAAPPGLSGLLGALPQGVVVSTSLRGKKDYIHAFVRDRARLELRFPSLKRALEPDGMLWISWPKKASGVETDLSEDVVRRIGLETGLVDVKVCAVDQVWSGLKFVFRLRDRR